MDTLPDVIQLFRSQDDIGRDGFINGTDAIERKGLRKSRNIGMNNFDSDQWYVGVKDHDIRERVGKYVVAPKRGWNGAQSKLSVSSLHGRGSKSI